MLASMKNAWILVKIGVEIIENEYIWVIGSESAYYGPPLDRDSFWNPGGLSEVDRYKEIHLKRKNIKVAKWRVKTRNSR